MTETAEPEVRYDPDGTADFTPQDKPVYWRTGSHRFQVAADPSVDTLLEWIARARMFAEEMGGIGGDGDLSGFDEQLANRVRDRIIGLFEPIHTPEAQAAFADAVGRREISLGTVLRVIRWLPSQLGLGSGVPTPPSSGLSAGPPPPADGTSSTGGQPSTVSISGGSLSPGSSVSPGTP
jgi:hypothetical protein